MKYTGEAEMIAEKQSEASWLSVDTMFKIGGLVLTFICCVNYVVLQTGNIMS